MRKFYTGIIKTEWVIESPKFGKRRIWKDGGGYFYLVGNIAYRNYDGDDFEVYKAERVSDIHDDNVLFSGSSIIKHKKR